MNVVDLQEMADPEKDRYALTDPAIHHESLSKFFNSGSSFGAAWMTTSSSMSSHVVEFISFLFSLLNVFSVCFPLFFYHFFRFNYLFLLGLSPISFAILLRISMKLSVGPSLTNDRTDASWSPISSRVVSLI